MQKINHAYVFVSKSAIQFCRIWDWSSVWGRRWGNHQSDIWKMSPNALKKFWVTCLWAVCPALVLLIPFKYHTVLGLEESYSQLWSGCGISHTPVSLRHQNQPELRVCWKQSRSSAHNSSSTGCERTQHSPLLSLSTMVWEVLTLYMANKSIRDN